jgi:hypothetical protein
MVYIVDSSASISDINITLPTLTLATQGITRVIKDGAGFCSQTNKGIVITPSGGNLIDGQATFRMENDFMSITIIGLFGVGWFII